jgi:voltage-gated potassium channel
MADGEGRPKELKNTEYEIFIALVSLLAITNLVLVNVIEDPHLDTVLLAMNVLLSCILLGDFLYRLLTAESKSEYLGHQFGWADLVASMPFPPLKVFRIFRLVRVVRLLRANGTTRILRSLVKDRAGSALALLLLMGILVLEFGSLYMLHIEEHASGANITTASDALWYVIVTISTVGYGDLYPVTTHGRIVGALIIVIGVGIFGTFTGYLANLFLSPPKESTTAEPLPAPDDVRLKLSQLKALMAEQQAAIDEIDRLLESEADPNPV